MPPRFQRFLGTEGILGKVRCHTEKGICHRPRTGRVHLMISYYGRVAILGYIEIQLFMCVHINLSNKQTNKTKQREKGKKERKRNRNRTGEKCNIQRYGAPKWGRSKIGDVAVGAYFYLLYFFFFFCVRASTSISQTNKQNETARERRKERKKKKQKRNGRKI